MLDYAPSDLAAEMVPRVLRGDETWCQGFSEPGAGSGLASLACRATRTDHGWEVNGQKVWTSLAQYAQRCVLLTRTGTPESAHRGITALFVDMDSPGITVRPIGSMHGVAEFCEVFFDSVVVPADRVLGEVDGGWSIAMDLLPYERSTALWHRAAYLQRRLAQLVAVAPEGALDPDAVGRTIELLWAFRARSRSTQYRLAGGERLGAETSVDKILVASAEQALFDLVGEALGPEIAIGDDPASGQWRAEFLYARAATIYGGSAEIERNIVERVASSSSGTIADGGTRSRALRPQRPPCHPCPHRRPTRRRAGGPRLGGRAPRGRSGRRLRPVREPGVGQRELVRPRPGPRPWARARRRHRSAARRPAPPRSLRTPRKRGGNPLRDGRPRPPWGLVTRDGRRRGPVRERTARPRGADRRLLTWRTASGIDPKLALEEVWGDVALDTTEPLGCATSDDALVLGQLALAHELTGAARAMLELARRHALEREQFGRPIGAFQAVRHRLADALVWVEAAASLLEAAWEDPVAYGAMAKAFAGRAASLVARHVQQVVAGIGFTTEHPLHHYVRRVIVLDQLLGAGTSLTRRLGADALAAAALPPVVPL